MVYNAPSYYVMIIKKEGDQSFLCSRFSSVLLSRAALTDSIVFSCVLGNVQQYPDVKLF